MRGGRTPLLLLLLLATTAACTSTTATPAPPSASPTLSAPIAWRPVALPSAPGGIGVTVRDIARCGDHWLAVGAVRLAADPTVAPNEQPTPAFRPGAWLTDPQGRWRSLTMRPISYYGERAILRSVACRDGAFVAVGAASGGAHGNPRVTTWRGVADGLAENPNNDFQLFGGPAAIGVGRIVAGGPGFVIVGNWLDPQNRPAPTVWLSSDGRSWRRLPDNPTFASTAGQTKHAADLLSATDSAGGSPGQLLLVGQESDGSTYTPFLASSTDGLTWHRVPVPGTGNLLAVGGGVDLIALGRRADAVVSWHRPAAPAAAQWHETGSFTPDKGPQPAEVGGVVQVGPTTLAAGCGGVTCALLRSEDFGAHWLTLPLPAVLAARADSTVRLAAGGGSVLLLLDDGKNAQMFLVGLPL